MDELIDGEPEHVAINDGHPRDAPVFGARLNPLVQLWDAGESAKGEPRRELARGVIQFRLAQFGPISAHQLVGASRSVNIRGKEHLQSAFARLTS